MKTAPTAENYWETRWISAEGTSDPAYERTTAALRRWVDGMEKALLATAATRRAGVSRGGRTVNLSPDRR